MCSRPKKRGDPPSQRPSGRVGEGGINTPMAIIWPCSLAASSYEAAGRQIAVPAQTCPSCNQELTGWGGYPRWVRSERTHEYRIWIRRGWCGRCRRTQAFLPSFLFARRLDTDEVIGSALTRAAGGRGTRPIAQEVGLPHTTVRDWWRRVKTKAPCVAGGLAEASHEPGYRTGGHHDGWTRGSSGSLGERLAAGPRAFRDLRSEE